jgi:hypothetical protein
VAVCKTRFEKKKEIELERDRGGAKKSNKIFGVRGGAKKIKQDFWGSSTTKFSELQLVIFISS